MREEFKAFYNANDDKLQEIWNSENTLFVFDTNVLLNLYGYAENTRSDFFKVLEGLKDKLWIPYHVGIEYQRRRLDIIRNEKKVFSDIDKNLETIQSIFKGEFEKLALRRRFPKLFDSTEKLESEIKKSIANYKKSVTHWNTSQPDVRSEDKIREKIDSFFENKIGKKPESQEWLDAIFTDGKSRFESKIPPGFGDTNKSKDPNEASFIFNSLNYQRQYGDLILWKQLIEKAKEDVIQNIVFITDDAKVDWWQIIDSNGKKQIGALPELSAEIHRESDVKNFHMYSTSSFMEDGEKLLNIELDESSIEDASIQHREFISSASNYINLFKKHKSPFGPHESLFETHETPFETDENPFEIDENPLKIYRNPFVKNENLFEIYNRKIEIENYENYEKMENEKEILKRIKEIGKLEKYISLNNSLIKLEKKPDTIKLLEGEVRVLESMLNKLNLELTSLKYKMRQKKSI